MVVPFFSSGRLSPNPMSWLRPPKEAQDETSSLYSVTKNKASSRARLLVNDLFWRGLAKDSFTVSRYAFFVNKRSAQLMTRLPSLRARYIRQLLVPGAAKPRLSSSATNTQSSLVGVATSTAEPDGLVPLSILSPVRGLYQ